MAFADQHSVDAIATGAHGRSLAGRLVLGRVSAKIIRSAHSWVLVAPPRVEAAETTESFEPNAEPAG